MSNRERVRQAIVGKSKDKIEIDEHDGRVIRNGRITVVHVWDRVQLSKSERKGLTDEQIQAARKSKWLAQYEGHK